MITASLQQHWLKLTQPLTTSETSRHTWQILHTYYTKPNRHYHNLQHIADCLNHWNQARPNLTCTTPLAVEFAIWFHDVIYTTDRNDNETASANFAHTCLADYALPSATLQDIANLIQATDHRSPPTDENSALIQDIDLTILGSPADVYQQYSANIRLEYNQFPDNIYNPGRKQVLQNFLEKERIYNTRHFFNAFEQQARSNLTTELQTL